MVRKTLIRGLIFAFAGILLFVSTTKIDGVNSFIISYWWLIIAIGIGGFIYGMRLTAVRQQIVNTISAVFIFRGLVSAPFVDQIITQYPLPALILAVLMFYFHENLFSITRLS